MPNANPSLILEHLEHIRGTVDQIDGRLGGFEGRITSLEGDFLTLAKAEASRSLEFVALTKRLARLETRIEKLEQRPAPAKKTSGTSPPTAKQPTGRSRKS